MSSTKSVNSIYFATITNFGEDCPDDFVAKSKEYFAQFEMAIACTEKQQNGNDHVHAMFVSTDGRTDSIRKKIKKGCYDKSARTSIPPNALKVEKVKSQCAIIKYILKEVSDEKPLLVRSGYKVTWLQEQADEATKKKKVFIKWLWIKPDQVPGMLNDYCDTNNIKITCKQDFVNLLIKMEDRGYNTRLWSKNISWIYGQIMRMQGDRTQTEKYWMNLLNFD